MDLVQFLLGIACLIGPLLLGWMIGGTRERRHFQDLDAREARIRGHVIVTQNRTLLVPVAGKQPPQMLTSEVVIASDYLKSFLASWRGFFGGEVRSYRTLLERARREATLRIVEEAEQLGYNAVGNIRLETADLGGANTGRGGAAMAAIVATATVYHSQFAVREDDGPAT